MSTKLRVLKSHGIEATSLSALTAAFNAWVAANGNERTLQQLEYQVFAVTVSTSGTGTVSYTNEERHKLVIIYQE